MRKIISSLMCITLLFLFSLLFFTTTVFAVETTVTFDNLGYKDTDVINDGTDLGGLKFEVDNDRGMYFHKQNEGFHGTSGVYPNTQAYGDVICMSFTKADNTDFKFVSVWIGANYGDMSIDAEGYLDGVKVESFDELDISSDGTHTFNWDCVDEVKFRVSKDLYCLFDNITYDDPVIPNNTPTISISDTTLDYTENDEATQIDASATTSDADGDADFDRGQLKVQITANNEAADELSIKNSADGINTNGTNLYYNGTDIGDLSVSSGTVTNGTSLTITFNSNATNALVQKTLRAISYRNMSETPGTSNRTVTFTVTDNNGASANDTRTISVSNVNDAPTISNNTWVTLDEGAEATITNTHLSATDIDGADGDIAYTITLSPLNGQLENTDNPGVSITSFTQENIDDSKITYVHDGSNTTSDSFVFKISDGTKELTGQTFSISVTPVDNNAPTISKNTGVTLDEGAEGTITNTHLSATDSEVVDGDIAYTITSSSSNGQLENTDNPGVAITSFTQRNVDDGKIKYIHDGSNITSDSFVFKISDGTNELTGQTFSISVTPVDDDAPTISKNTGVTLDEGAEATITNTHLSATDSEVVDRDIAYTITLSPSNGAVENTDNLGVSITDFTQRNIDDGKIKYIHDGSNTTSDSFVFKISDGTNELTGQTFSISVTSVYSVIFNSNGGSDVTGVIDATHSSTITAPTAPTKSGYTFGGWYKESGCTNEWDFSSDVVTEDMTLHAKWIVKKSSSNRKSSSDSDPTTPLKVEVNGQKQESLAQVQTQNQNGQEVTTVKVDEQKLEEKLNKVGQKATVTIPVQGKEGTVVGQLNGEMIKTMEEKEAILEIKTEKADYILPANQIKIDQASQQLGEKVELKDIKVEVVIGKTSKEMVKVVESTARKEEFTLVVPPVDFIVKCSHKDKTVEVKSFSGYVKRTIAIPKGVDPNKITTGIIVYPDGSSCHVPTKIIQIDGKYYAKINSITNSTYSVIWNPKEYKDLEGHWAKEVCNEMGARMIVDGETGGIFSPDKQVTRLFFTQTVVRALGLGEKGTQCSLKDVDENKPYFGVVATSVEYNLISGYEDNTFRAYNNITREEAAALIVRTMKIAGLKVDYIEEELQQELNKFIDKDQIGPWAREVVAICVKNGLIVGDEKGEFSPRENMTKAQLATIIKRMLEKAGLI